MIYCAHFVFVVLRFLLGFLVLSIQGARSHLQLNHLIFKARLLKKREHSVR